MRPETGQPVGANAARARLHNRQIHLHQVPESGPIGQAETSEDLERLFGCREPALMRWLAQAVEALSSAIRLIENLFNPESFIIGGVMPAVILDEMVERVVPPARSVSNRRDRDHPRLVRGTTGRMTATYGAAALVLDRAFSPKIAITSKRSPA
jgi:predicted NBD/HSP70 family sugar kinase